MKCPALPVKSKNQLSNISIFLAYYTALATISCHKKSLSQFVAAVWPVIANIFKYKYVYMSEDLYYINYNLSSRYNPSLTKYIL